MSRSAVKMGEENGLSDVGNSSEISERLLTPKQVGDRYGINPLTASRWGKAGKIPAPVASEPRFTRWREEDINQHIRNMGKAQ